MCGFVGSVWSNGALDAGVDLQAALAILARRGPDGQGILRSDGVALGHRRLSVIDVSSRASQPMEDVSGRYVMVFNGEIYNYQELSRSLLTDFTGNRESDTAVLLELYRRMGPRVLEHLTGMFSFAVFDRTTRETFLVRDRFGEKPLYYLAESGRLTFASELSAMRALLPGRPWKIDPNALALFGSIGSVPSPHTVYLGVQSLKPGHWMVWSPEKGPVEGRYWSLANEIGPEKRRVIRDRGEAIERVRVHLRKAVQNVLVSDVPVGLFLSGGMDSGAIAATVGAIGRRDVKALCIDFPEQEYSEYRAAKATASRFGLDLARFEVDERLFFDHLDRFFAVSDQPTTDGFNTFFATMCAKSLGIKVWLSGVGGDESFGGYPFFRRAPWMTKAIRVARSLPGVQVLFRDRHVPPRSYRVSRILQALRPGDPLKRAYQLTRCPVPSLVSWKGLVRQVRPTETEFRRVFEEVYPTVPMAADAFQTASMLEAQVYMASQLLRDIDNYSMANGIEMRAPFLNHHLFSSVLRLPEALKHSGKITKPLLYEAIGGDLPPEVARGPKRGFTFPLGRWIRGHVEKTFLDYALHEKVLAYYERSVIEEIWSRFRSNRLPWQVLWLQYVIARWLVVHG